MHNSKRRLAMLAAVPLALTMLAAPASAMPCANCDPGGGGGGGVGSTQLYRFEPVSLSTHGWDDLDDAEVVFGDCRANCEDEIRLDYDGQTLYRNDHVQAVTTMTGLPQYLFTSGATITLTEEDDWPGADDWLGNLALDSNMAGAGDRTFHFDRDGAYYELIYHVVQVS